MKQVHNPNQTAPVDLPVILEDDDPMSALKEGLAYEVDDLVKLELTAEQMLQDEAQLVMNYMAGDAKHFWSDLKEGFLDLEVTTGELLLKAADPTSVEWQRDQWWGNNPHINDPIK